MPCPFSRPPVGGRTALPRPAAQIRPAPPAAVCPTVALLSSDCPLSPPTATSAAPDAHRLSPLTSPLPPIRPTPPPTAAHIARGDGRRRAALYPLAAVRQAAGKKKRTTISSRKDAGSKRCPKYGRNKHCAINRPPKTVVKGKGTAVRKARFLQRKKAELSILCFFNRHFILFAVP